MKYEDIDALNWSTLKLMQVSPAYLKHQAEHPEERKDTDAYRLGRADHCALLEPDRFMRDYLVMPYFGNMQTNAAKDKKIDWLSMVVEERTDEPVDVPEFDHLDTRNIRPAKIGWLERKVGTIPGLEIITQDESDAAMKAADAVRSHGPAMELLRGAKTEQTAQWINPETGIKCKGRIDALTDRVTDLKMTRHATLWEVMRAAANYDYHGQVAWYHDGAVQAGLIHGHVLPAAIFVHAPKDSTFVDVAVLSMGYRQETFEAGRALYRNLIERYAGAQATGWWPGMATDAVPWDLPAWKLEG